MDDYLVGQILTAAVLVVIELARSVPAWVRVRRTLSTDGVSPVSTGVLAGTGPGWIAVAVIADSPAGALASSVWLAFHLLLWREAARLSSSKAARIKKSALWSAAGMSGFVLAGLISGEVEVLLGIAIGCAAAVYSIPALAEGMRSTTTRGLSATALSVNSLEGAIYLAGGAGLGGVSPAGDVVLGYILFGAVALSSNLPRLARVATRRHRGLDDATTA